MDKKLKMQKDDFKDVVKSTLIAIVASLIFVLVFAIVIKFFAIDAKIINPINVALKSISLIIGVLFGIKNAKYGALKGFVVAMFYVLVTYILFSIINMQWKFDLKNLIDSGILLVEGIVAGVIAVNLKDAKGRK